MHEHAQILSTKKLLPNQKQFLLNAELSVVESDFIDIAYKNLEISTDADYLIFTSSNAVRSILKTAGNAKLKQIPCFCVGEKTKNLLEQNGFQVLVSTDHAESLAETIIRHRSKLFLLLSGNLRLDTIPLALQKSNMNFEEVEVYETVKTPIQINTKPDGILFFSPSAVESYLQLNMIKDSTCFCIGTTTAKALAGITDNIITAHKPSIENVIIQAIKHFNKLHR